MDWAAIIAVIVQALLPVLLKWLEELLKESAADLANGPAPLAFHPKDGVRSLFTRARQKMTFFQWLWYGGALNRYERVMLRRADDVWECAKVGKPLELTSWERHEIEGY